MQQCVSFTFPDWLSGKPPPDENRETLPNGQQIKTPIVAVASATNNVMNRSIYALGRPTSLTNQSLHIARRRPPSILKWWRRERGDVLWPPPLLPPTRLQKEQIWPIVGWNDTHTHTHIHFWSNRANCNQFYVLGWKGKGEGEGVKGDVLW